MATTTVQTTTALATMVGRTLTYDAPYGWGGGYATTTYYSAPVSYGYRYRRVVRPAYAYYRGSYPIVRHRWHHHHW